MNACIRLVRLGLHLLKFLWRPTPKSLAHRRRARLHQFSVVGLSILIRHHEAKTYPSTKHRFLLKVFCKTYPE